MTGKLEERMSSDFDRGSEPAAVAALWNDTRAAGFSMASDPRTCSLLRMLAATKPSGRFLELGSGTGLSTAWILDGMDGASSLLTVDNDASVLAILRQHLGSDPRLEIVCADGDAFLPSLKVETFDFIFADTWPGKYRHLEEALQLLKPGGLYVIDDMLPQPNWPVGHGARVKELIDRLENDQRLHVSTMAWASGLLLAARLNP
jgi:predicted O-methyltransferase YrrM